MIGHEIKYHEYIHMLQLDKTLAHLFSLQILKTKMNLLIKLHLYSHVGDKNYENKICDKMDKQYLRRESPYSS